MDWNDRSFYDDGYDDDYDDGLPMDCCGDGEAEGSAAVDLEMECGYTWRSIGSLAATMAGLSDCAEGATD